nr:mucin-16-like [Loxodonta africana]
MDTHIPLSTSSTGMEDSVITPESATVTMSSGTDTSELSTSKLASTTVIPSTVLSKKTIAAERWISGHVNGAYSTVSPWSGQTAGSDWTLGTFSEATDTLHITSNSTDQPTSLVSPNAKGQPIISPTNASGGKIGSSPSATFPSIQPKSLVATTTVATRDSASTPGQLSSTPSVGMSTGGILIPGVTISIITMGTSSVGTTMPSPEGSVSTTNSIVATETASKHPPHWPSSAASAPTSGPWTITDLASNLEVTTSPKAISAVGTTSSLALTTASGSGSTPHGPVTTTGTSLVTPPSSASAEKIYTSVRTLSPSDTTASMPISTSSGVQGLSTSVPDISSTSWSPSRTETEVLPVSVPSTGHLVIKTDTNTPLHTPPPDPLSTVDWITGGSASSATITTSAPQGGTTPPKLPLETAISPATYQLFLSIGGITSGITPDAMISSNGVTFSGSQGLTSREAEQSSTYLPTTNSATLGFQCYY